MIQFFRVLSFALWAALPTAALADAYAGLPLALDDQNTLVTFEVDSTWHLIHSNTRGISGKVWLEESGNPDSLQADVLIPVALFDTDNSRRDSRLREVMAAQQFPQVHARITRMKSCNQPQCSTQAQIKLEVRGIEKEFKMPVQFETDPHGSLVSGSLSFKWKDFEVEDPSILVAKLDEDVLIKFQIRIPDRK